MIVLVGFGVLITLGILGGIATRVELVQQQDAMMAELKKLNGGE